MALHWTEYHLSERPCVQRFRRHISITVHGHYTPLIFNLSENFYQKHKLYRKNVEVKLNF